MSRKLASLDKTRGTLLNRLKDLNDSDSWREFFDKYWLFVFRISTRKGLSEAEAEEVTQEAMIRVAKAMPSFQYARKRGSFKNWLSQIVRNIIIDQYRKKKISTIPLGYSESAVCIDEAIIVENHIDKIWDQEWRRNMINLALKGAQNRLSLKEYQIFHLNVILEHPASVTAEMVGVSVPRVYLAKFRAGRIFRQEYNKIKKDII